MIRIACLFTLLTIVSTSAFSQNIVPDPGFENWDGTIGQNPNTLGGLNLWYEVHGTPDHHHINNPPGNNLTSLDTTCATGMGQNQCGFPCEGLATLGAYKANGVDGTKEWSAIALSEPMEIGKTYDVSMWLQNKKDNPDFLMATNQWGVFFSESSQPTIDPDNVDFSTMTNQFVTCSEIIASSEWVEVSWEYECDANYTHIFVGYVGNVDDALTNAWSDSGSVGFYVWVDKVSIIEQVETAIEQNAEDQPSVYPVPTSDYLTVDLRAFTPGPMKAQVFDSFGKQVREIQLSGGALNRVSVVDLENGYFSLVVDGFAGPIRFAKD